MPGPESRTEPTFGQIAVRHGFATATQVNACVQIQNEERRSGRDPRHLGQIMISQGLLTQEQVQEIIRITSQERSAPTLQIPGYQVLSKLGQGGMGAVYKAKQISMDRLVALKLLPTRLAQNKNYIDRFYQEARAAGRLNHENIVRAYDVGESNGLHFFSMEFIEGENVQSMLRKQKHLEERLVLNIALQMGRALDHAHKHNLVHRDVKPENIMITAEGVAKLCDLGLAKDTSGDSSLTQVGTCVGTPHYIAPEQARGEQDIDIRADIYSLGASMFHMLIGEPVFNGPSPAVVMTKHLTDPVPPPHTLRPGISQQTSSIILKCMAKQREDRYQTPAELISDVESALAGGTVSEPAVVRAAAPKTGNTRRLKDTRQERAIGAAIGRAQPPPSGNTAMVAGLAAIVVVGILVVVLMGRGQEAKQPPPPPTAGAVEPGRPEPAPPAVAAPSQAHEDKAKEGLGVIEEFRKEHGKDPKRYLDVVQMYTDFFEHAEFKFTRWSIEARKRLDEYKKEIEAHAATVLEPIQAKAEALASEERFLDAAKALEEFPPEYAFTDAGARAARARDGFLAQAHAKVENDLRKAEQLGDDRKYDEAKLLLESAKPLCDPPQLVRANDLLVKIDQARVTYERERMARAAEIYDDLRKRLHRALRDRKWDAARGEIEKGRKDPALVARAEDLLHDLEEIALLEQLYRDAVEGAKKLAGDKKTVRLTKFDQPVGTILEGDQVLFRVGGARVALSFDSLSRTDVVALASKFLDTSPETRFKYGLLYFFGVDFENPSKENEETMKLARAELDAARKKDPRAERYLRWLDDLRDASLVGAAKKLYEEAKGSFAAHRWIEAQTRITQLLKTYGETSFVRDRKDELEGMLKSITEKIEADRKATQGVFAVVPKELRKDGWIDITYDFEDEAQGADWEAYAPQFGRQSPQGEWGITLGQAMGRGHKYFYWKPRLKGDVTVEFTVIAVEDRNLGVQFCDDRQGRFYRATLGYQPYELFREIVGGWGGFDPRGPRNDDPLQVKRNSIVRFDIPAIIRIFDWRDRPTMFQRIRDEGHKTLGGENDPEITKTRPYKVVVARKGDDIEYWLNGASMAKAKDGAYKEGYLALWCDVSPDPAGPSYAVSGKWDNVRIAGQLDLEWLSQALESKK